MGWILLTIYIIGIFICAWAFPKLFPYREGGWEYDCGEIMPIDENIHKIRIEGLVALWPIVIAFCVLLLPAKLITILIDMFYGN